MNLNVEHHILDVPSVVEFLRKHASDFKKWEVILILMLARKKHETNPNFKSQLKWEVKLSWTFLDKTIIESDAVYDILDIKFNYALKMYHQGDGVYKKGQIYFTRDAITVYYVVNPLHFIKGYLKSMTEMERNLIDVYEGDQTLKELVNIDKYVLRSVHKTTSRTKHLILDLDKQNLIDDVLDFLISHCQTSDLLYYWIKTRNGHHVVITLPENKHQRKEVGKLIYQDLRTKFPDVEIKSANDVSYLPHSNYTINGEVFNVEPIFFD